MASCTTATTVRMIYDPGISTRNNQMNDGVDTVDAVARKSFDDKLKLTWLYITRLDTYLREKFWSENNIPYEVSIASPVWIYCRDTRIVVLIEKISLLCQRILENVCNLRLQYDSVYKDNYETSSVEWLINTEIRILQYKKTGQFQTGNIINLKMAVINSIEDTVWNVCNETCDDIVPRGKTDPRVTILELSYHSYTILEDLYTCNCKELVINKLIPREVASETSVHQQQNVTKSEGDLDLHKLVVDYSNGHTIGFDFAIGDRKYGLYRSEDVAKISSHWSTLAEKYEPIDRGKLIKSQKWKICT